LNVHNASDVRQIEKHAAEPLVPGPSWTEVEIASAKFKKDKSPVTNQNFIQEEINRKLKSGNDCYHSIRNPLSSRPLSKNVKIRICKTIILPAVLYGYETWSLTESVRRMFGPKRDEVTGRRRKLRYKELPNLSRRMRGAGHVARMRRR
jgi:hypothetical protein